MRCGCWPVVQMKESWVLPQTFTGNDPPAGPGAAKEQLAKLRLNYDNNDHRRRSAGWEYGEGTSRLVTHTPLDKRPGEMGLTNVSIFF